jgi:hypothetical protein
MTSKAEGGAEALAFPLTMLVVVVVVIILGGGGLVLLRSSGSGSG